MERIFIIAIITILFAGCAEETAFKGVLEGEWPCVPGKRLAIWLDSNNDGIINDNKYLGTITTFSGSDYSDENYNYFSDSAHPLIGPTPMDFESHVFFYEGPDGLTLNFYHNIDKEGSADNIVKWQIVTEGNNLDDDVVLSDDPGELQLIDVDHNLEKKEYLGDFHYWYNTDGGVIGPFNGEGFTIRVFVEESGDNLTGTFYSANGQAFCLEESDEIVSFIISYEEYMSCNNN